MIAIWGAVRKKHIRFLYNTTAYPKAKIARRFKIIGYILLILAIAAVVFVLINKLF